MAKRPTIREQLLTLNTLYTQKELAVRLGVSERSIRYWKNSGKIPSKESTLETIKTKASQAKAQITRREKSYTFKDTRTRAESRCNDQEGTGSDGFGDYSRDCQIK